MDALPQHVVTLIVQHGVAGPKPQLELLRVCSDFYLAALPILYHSPRITYKIDSFFLHTSAAIPDDYESLSARELVVLGHTKLAALRHVRHLRMAVPSIYYHQHPETIASAEDLNTAFEVATAQVSKVYQRTATAREHLQSLPAGVMPQLETVQGGDLKGYDSESLRGLWGRSETGELGAELLKRAHPRAWCQQAANIDAIAFPISKILLGRDTFNLPTALHMHVYSNSNDTLLFPGSTTYLYVHPFHLPDSSETSVPSSETMSEWLANSIEEVWEEPFLDATEIAERRTLKRNSRVVVCLADAPTARASLSRAAEDGGDESREIEQIVARASAILAQAGGDLGEIKVEGWIAADMPICPACGMGGGASW